MTTPTPADYAAALDFSERFAMTRYAEGELAKVLAAHTHRPAPDAPAISIESVVKLNNELSRTRDALAERDELIAALQDENLRLQEQIAAAQNAGQLQ